MSNAVIEAALAKRPIIYVNTDGFTDIFGQEQAFGGAVKTPEVLTSRLLEIEQDYLARVAVSESFARFHLAGGFLGLQRTFAILEALICHVPLPPEIESSVLPTTMKPFAQE
jgi:hypothetical protein